MTFDTARLHLRQHIADDLANLHALTADGEVRRHLVSEPPSLSATFDRLLRTVGGWTLFGYSTMAVIERASGDYVGNCGLFRACRELGDGFDGFPEAGWIIAESRWGLGYATEAMTAVLAWFDAAIGGRTVCMIAPGNAGSERIAAKLGYREMGKAEYKGEPIMRYARIP